MNHDSNNQQSKICSLKDLNIRLSKDVRQILVDQYTTAATTTAEADAVSNRHVNAILQTMKRPSSVVVCRMNHHHPRTSSGSNDNHTSNSSLEETIQELKEELRKRWRYNFHDVDCNSDKNDEKDQGKSNDNIHGEKVIDSNDGNNDIDFQITIHPIFQDVLLIRPQEPKPTITATTQSNILPCTLSKTTKSLYDCSVPRAPSLDNHDENIIFKHWPKRELLGWPMTHRVVICDRFCGEAVLRGSDIFKNGILCADHGIQYGEKVAVYADLGGDDHEDDDKAMDESNNDNNTTNKSQKKKQKMSKKKKKVPPVPRGASIEQYPVEERRCVFLGLGFSCCKTRSDFFNHNLSRRGLGIVMSRLSQERCGPVLPPLSGLLPDKLYFQNIPSIGVGYALNPQPGDVILDMCCAPGGKTLHLAALTNNQATIVACDKSAKKIAQLQELCTTIYGSKESFSSAGITPLALDTTNCCKAEESDKDSPSFHSVIEILEQTAKNNSNNSNNGGSRITKFHPESFDRILLDPPCSALGLRPKLKIPFVTKRDLYRHVLYQKQFVQQAIRLLKPGGILTYSTCTIHGEENEGMVHYMLKEFGGTTSGKIKLLPIDFSAPSRVDSGSSESNRALENDDNHRLLDCGCGPGLAGFGLNDTERQCVKRFDPIYCDPSNDDSNDMTMGFFIAKFQKINKVR